MDDVLGINRRNLEFIYPYNPRKHFPIANDKFLMKELFTQKHIPIPPTHAVISRMGQISLAWDAIQKLDEFVIKPAKGKTGNGILVLKKDSIDSWHSPSGKSINSAQINKHLADILFGVFSFGMQDKAIIEYKVNMHQKLRNIYDKGVSDIRVILFRDKIVMCMARIPTDKANGRANLHQGAIGVGIDMETGTFEQGYNKEGYMDVHPDSGTLLRGFVIPYWDTICNISRQASRAVALDYLGVDIVIDEVMGPLVLEINARPGLEIQNVNRSGLYKILKELK